MSSTSRGAILLNVNDNVATALEAMAPQTEAVFNLHCQSRTVRVIENIPQGHKFAVLRIPAGQEVIKYGEVIGLATEPIDAGQLVHTHNVASQRGRGDRAP